MPNVKNHLGQDFSRRKPHIGEVWSHYRRLGVDPPISLGKEKLLKVADLALIAVEFGQLEPPNNRSELLGKAYYEIGQISQGTDSEHAAWAFQRSLHWLSKSRYRNPDEILRQQTLLDTVRLFISRTDPEERAHRLQTNATVRSLGKHITNSHAKMTTMTQDQKRNMRGPMVETAFLATFLTLPNEALGAPATERQDSPKTGNHVGYKHAIQGIQQVCGIDANLYHFNSAPEPMSVIPTQIKFHEGNSAGMYRDDILMLYANRELFVDNDDELLKYATSLANYRGEPDKALATAGSNIELAIVQFIDDTNLALG